MIRIFGRLAKMLWVRSNPGISPNISVRVNKDAIGSARQAGEGEEPIIGLLQAVGNSPVLEPGLATKALRRVSSSSRVPWR
jgi:hypothetical protein